MKTWWSSLYDSERREKEAMPLRSGAFSMAGENNPITYNTAFQTETRSKSESDSRG
jgi:hypothetical protein